MTLDVPRITQLRVHLLALRTTCIYQRHMADDEMQAELERLRQENEALKRRGSKGISLKVSAKGAVSVYGLGRFPVTLYKEQWVRLLDLSEDIRSFIRENEGSLKAKE